MAITSNKSQSDFPTIISETDGTRNTIATKQLTGGTGRVYTIHVNNNEGADLFVALYDSDNPTIGTDHICLFRVDSGIDMTVVSKTGIPISTGLSVVAAKTDGSMATEPSGSASQIYIFGS